MPPHQLPTLQNQHRHLVRNNNTKRRSSTTSIAIALSTSLCIGLSSCEMSPPVREPATSPPVREPTFEGNYTWRFGNTFFWIGDVTESYLPEASPKAKAEVELNVVNRGKWPVDLTFHTADLVAKDGMRVSMVPSQMSVFLPPKREVSIAYMTGEHPANLIRPPWTVRFPIEHNHRGRLVNFSIDYRNLTR